jgi:predicted dehydrogenase
MHLAMLGTGLIGDFYAAALQGKRARDRVAVVYSRSAERGAQFAARHGIPRFTADLREAVAAAEVEAVVVALPNHLHETAVAAAVEAGKAVLCTKPLGRTAEEAWRMLRAVERAGVPHGYLEDLVYTPKTLQALAAVQAGSLGKVLWVRSRETHSGPHSAWFWSKELAGGGAIVDLGCHCIEIARNFIGKSVRPAEVMCWAATQVHPIETEDHAIGLVRYENGAVGQFEVSWAFRGGMDLRDEVVGSEGTLWLNHWLRTGAEMFTTDRARGYVAEKAEAAAGWNFPVGDEAGALGYVDMFADVLTALEQQRAPRETFYDGYVVNAVMDAAYASVASKRWEPVELVEWRAAGRDAATAAERRQFDAEHDLLKSELLPDGQRRVLLKHKQTGEVIARTVD